VNEYTVPIERLPADPVALMELLVEAAGVRHCALAGCRVRWVGGNGHRLYCTEEHAALAQAKRDKWRREQRKGLAPLWPVEDTTADAMGRGAHDEGSTDEHNV
jgi:hypothetical protein